MANFKSNQINVKYIFILFLSLFLVSCNTTNPTDVKKSDTQRIKSTYYQVAGTAFAGKAAIMGALTLYLDFINLFIMLMQLFGQRR